MLYVSDAGFIIINTSVYNLEPNTRAHTQDIAICIHINQATISFPTFPKTLSWPRVANGRIEETISTIEEHTALHRPAVHIVSPIA